jgi:hypothetical protein
MSTWLAKSPGVTFGVHEPHEAEVLHSAEPLLSEKTASATEEATSIENIMRIV